jgi:phosphoglucosamine mutase
MLESALSAGFVSMGMDALLLGPIPTPAIGTLTRSMRADLGVMITASDLPAEYNDIRLFGPDGFKLSDASEIEIQNRLSRDVASASRAASGGLGRARRIEDTPGRYIELAKSTLPRGLRLTGLKIVVDCANGAARWVAPSTLWELGAEVIALGVEPNGTNINLGCGIAHAELTQQTVRHSGADLGIVLDGDGTRLIVIDERGQAIDGDQLIGVIARSWAASGRLKQGAVTGTRLSSPGLERFLAEQRIALNRVPAGVDRVIAELRRSGGNLGGDSCGRIAMTDFATTGDGLVAALQVLAALAPTKQSASAFLRAFEPVPPVSEAVAGPLPALRPVSQR